MQKNYIYEDINDFDLQKNLINKPAKNSSKISLEDKKYPIYEGDKARNTAGICTYDVGTDTKLKVLESKVVPRDLSNFEFLEWDSSEATSAFIYVDKLLANGKFEPAKLKLSDIKDAASYLSGPGIKIYFDPVTEERKIAVDRSYGLTFDQDGKLIIDTSTIATVEKLVNDLTILKSSLMQTINTVKAELELADNINLQEAKSYTDTETTRALGAEFELDSKINNMSGLLQQEEAIRSEADNALSNIITDEITAREQLAGRVAVIEDLPASGITAVQIASWDNEVGANEAIIAEQTRAKAVELDISANVNSLENTKQDNISDLDTIRSGAALGATAIQEHQSLAAYSLINETGNKIDLELDNNTYELLAKLYDKNNNLLSTSTIVDLPLEEIIISIAYDETTKELVITLKSGVVTRIPIGDIISGLASQTYVDNAINIEDLNIKNWIETKGYATNDYVNTEITLLDNKKQDNYEFNLNNVDTEINYIAINNKIQSFSAENIKNINITVPENINYSYGTEVNFKVTSTIPIVIVNNLSRFNLKLIYAGNTIQEYMPSQKLSNVNTLFYCDGINVYGVITEIAD